MGRWRQWRIFQFFLKLSTNTEEGSQLEIVAIWKHQAKLAGSSGSNLMVSAWGPMWHLDPKDSWDWTPEALFQVKVLNQEKILGAELSLYRTMTSSKENVDLGLGMAMFYLKGQTVNTPALFWGNCISVHHLPLFLPSFPFSFQCFGNMKDNVSLKAVQK